MPASLADDGQDLFRRLLHLPDEVKNQPPPPDLQEQFIRWRKRLMQDHPERTSASVNTAEPYARRLTVRLLAYYLEILLRQAT
jgi:hypothetical protein